MHNLKVGITAKQAKEISQLPNLLNKIEESIRVAASEGLSGVDIEGQLPYQIHVALRAGDYEMTWKSECKTTWIYWG